MPNLDKRVLDRVRSGRVRPVRMSEPDPDGHVYVCCGVRGCNQANKTHVVDVVWEMDPQELDRRWVRMELRCENGHGFAVLLRNRGGKTRVESAFLDDIVSPFAEGARW